MQKIRDQLIAAGRAERFGMELDPEHRPPAVRDGHDRSILALGIDQQIVRQRFPRDDEGVVARGAHRDRASREQPLAGMPDLADLPMYGHSPAYHPRPERLGNGLMSKADAEKGDFVAGADQIDAAAGA